METPKADEVAGQQRPRAAAGCNMLFIAILLLVLGAVIFIAWNRSPPDAPTPAATAVPNGLGGR